MSDLSEDELKALKSLAKLWARVEGWCAVNRWIGKTLIIGGVGLLILLSQGLDAIKNIFAWRP